MTLKLPKKMVVFFLCVCMIIPRRDHWTLAHTLHKTFALALYEELSLKCMYKKKNYCHYICI
jgi:hypothetical protein